MESVVRSNSEEMSNAFANEGPARQSAKTDDPRRMVCAELLGAHTHQTLNGIAVHIWCRGGRYLARGRFEGAVFGETLGSDTQSAAARLRQILVEIENGTYMRRSEARKRPMKHGPAPRLDFRQLVDRYIAMVRGLRGKQTSSDYSSRLVPVIEYAESRDVRRRWPLVMDVDGNLEFALGLRSFLFARTVTRNGHPTAEPRRMSARHIQNVLSTTSTMLHQAKQPELNLLPCTFVNPITRRIIGEKPHRDPLAPPKLPLQARIDVVHRMDAWQLATLTWSLILPQRPDELAGILVSDIVRDRREVVFASRWGGDDHNKARQSFRVAYPPEFDSILNWLIAGRIAGPLLRRRAVSEGRRSPPLHSDNDDEITQKFNEAIATAPAGEVQNAQDRKRVFRRLMLDFGGVPEDDLTEGFTRVLAEARPDVKARFYDLRAGVITSLREAGVSEILRHYICGRSLGRNSAVHYESQDLHGDMNRYFQHVRPLLVAIAARANEVGVA